MRIYLDHNATSPVALEHLRSLEVLISNSDGNPSSPHSSGRRAKLALEHSRSQVSKLLGCRDEEVIFCSGATEANNMAIQGVVSLNQQGFKSTEPKEVITSCLEHPSVMETLSILSERNQIKISQISSDSNGQMDLDHLKELLKLRPKLCTIIWAQNEVGSINDIGKISKIVKETVPECHVHVDGVQVLGKVSVPPLSRLSVDSAAFSAHKLGGLKGCGVLYLKSQSKLARLYGGGGQERARRPGTESMPAIISFGMIAEEVLRDKPWEQYSNQNLRQLILELLSKIPGFHLHGSKESDKMLPNTINAHIEGVSGDDLIINSDLEGFEISSGSACSSGSGRPSLVLKAMGFDDWVALNSIRISFSHKQKKDDLVRFAEALTQIVLRIRNFKNS